MSCSPGRTAYMVVAKVCVTTWRAVEVFMQDIINLWVTEVREVREYFTKLSSFMPHRLPML